MQPANLHPHIPRFDWRVCSAVCFSAAAVAAVGAIVCDEGRGARNKLTVQPGRRSTGEFEWLVGVGGSRPSSKRPMRNLQATQQVLTFRTCSFASPSSCTPCCSRHDEAWLNVGTRTVITIVSGFAMWAGEAPIASSATWTTSSTTRTLTRTLCATKATRGGACTMLICLFRSRLNERYQTRAQHAHATKHSATASTRAHQEHATHHVTTRTRTASSCWCWSRRRQRRPSCPAP